MSTGSLAADRRAAAVPDSAELVGSNTSAVRACLRGVPESVARVAAVVAADPDWHATQGRVLRSTISIEQVVAAQWSGNVRCLHVHAEIGHVAMFFAGHHTLREAVLRRVAEHPGLRGSFIPLDDDGRRMRVGVAPPPPPAQDPLSAAELHFIDFLVEQALRAWTHET